MDWWQECALHLHEIGMLLNSQNKMTPVCLAKLKYHTVFFLARWLRMCTTDNALYWKLHVLLCCLIPFGEESGMVSRPSAQGMENSYFWMNHHKRIFNRIVNTTKNRVIKMTHRRQIFMLNGVEDRLSVVKDATVRTGA